MKTFYINNKKNNHVNEYTVDGEQYQDLISYTTRVAYYNVTEGFIKVHGWFSATTASHINDFLEHHGCNRMTKAEMMQEPTIDV